MLVLSRRAGESFLIGDSIEVQVVSIKGDRVRIGVDAPRNISVLRRELIEEVRGANEEAASVSADFDALASLFGQQK